MTVSSELEWTEYKSRLRAVTCYGTYWIETSPSGSGYLLICGSNPCCEVFVSIQAAQLYAEQIHNHPIERKACFGFTDVEQAPYQADTHVRLTDLLRSYENMLTGDNLPERVAVQTSDLRTLLEAAHPYNLTVAREQSYAHASRIAETYINGDYEAQGGAAQLIFDKLRVLAKPAPSPSIGAYIWKIVDEMAVDNFTLRMKEKLAKKRAEGRSGWWNMTADDLSVMLRQHVDKGDPVDVANLCMFLSAHDQNIAPDTKPVDVAALLNSAALIVEGRCTAINNEFIQKLSKRNVYEIAALVADHDIKLGAAIRALSAEPAQGAQSGTTISAMQDARIERQKEWCPDQQPDLSFRGNEMAGEVGEACNVIKKLERERQGWRGSRSTKEELASELADVIHTAILCAVTAGIDLEAATVEKFNATSDKNDLRTRLPAAPTTEAGK